MTTTQHRDAAGNLINDNVTVPQQEGIRPNQNATVNAPQVPYNPQDQTDPRHPNYPEYKKRELGIK